MLQLGEDPRVCAEGGHQRWSGRGEETGAGSNLGRTRTLQPRDAPWGQHSSELSAQCKHPSQGRSTPKPAQQHPQTKVGDPRRAQHGPVVPKPSLAAAGVRLALLCNFSAPITAHLSPFAAVNSDATDMSKQPQVLRG